MIRKPVFGVILILVSLFYIAWSDTFPVNTLLDRKAKNRANTDSKNTYSYQINDYSNGKSPFITVDFLKGEHFWNPQIAIWIEDSNGKYLSTLWVTTSTAKGIFYGGRSADNFKDFDGAKTHESTHFRRVNALPHWSHKRSIFAKDGELVPHPDNPLPDAISGATPTDNFIFKTDLDKKIALPDQFIIKLEVNVAFDQNEYFSEYDFLEDTVYHSGTGLLGQPSLIYEARVSKSDSIPYYVMSIVGHGHHSAQTGDIFPDISKLTTAKKIVERILVKVNF